jgi:hypothetical protein
MRNDRESRWHEMVPYMLLTLPVSMLPFLTFFQV